MSQAVSESAPVDPEPTEASRGWGSRIRLLWLASILLLVALGSVARFSGVSDLILVGDEHHALHAIHRGFMKIFTYYPPGDNSIPYTLYARALHVTVGIDELLLRLPSMVSGVLLLLCPLLLVKRFGRSAVLIGVTLMTTSVILSYYSIIARPYMAACLLMLVAFAFWERWFRTGSRLSLLGFSTAAALAVFAHLFSLCGTMGLFGAMLLGVVKRRFSARELLGACAVFSLIVAVLLGPGVPSLVEAHASKIGEATGTLDADFFVEIAMVLGGWFHWYVSLLFLAILLGLVRFWSEDTLLGLALSAMFVLQGLAIFITRPLGIPIVWARYLLLVWPIALLVAAYGIVGSLQFVSSRWRRLLPVRWPVGGYPFVALSLACPVLALATFRNSEARFFRRELDSFRAMMESTYPDRTFHPELLPAPYWKILADPLAGEVILECPDPVELSEFLGWDQYQALHGKRVMIVSPEIATGEGVKGSMDNLVSLRDHEALTRTGARYLVLHVDPVRELKVEPRGGEARTRRLELQAAKAEVYLRQRYGRPVLWSHGLQVHDLTQEVGKPQDPLEWVMEFPLQPLSRISMREGEVEEHFDLSPLEEYDPHTYYRYKPNLDQKREFSEHPLGAWTLRTNGIGLRMDREVVSGRSDLRIVIAGDEQVDGACNNAETFGALLRAALESGDSDRTVEVLNAGHQGYSFYHYLGVFEKFLESNPDVFVMCVSGGSDFLETLEMYCAFAGPEQACAPGVDPGSTPTGTGELTWSTCLRSMIHFQRNPQSLPTALEVALEITVEIEEQCRANDIRFAVIYVPPLTDLDGDYRRELLTDAAISDVGVEDLTAIPRLAAAYLDNLRHRRIEVFDLGDRSIGAFEPLHYWKENHGLNVKAQRRIALHLWRAIGQ